MLSLSNHIITNCCLNLFHAEYLNLLSETKVQRSIWIFAHPIDDKTLDILNPYLEEHNKNAFFYMAYKVANPSVKHTLNTMDGLSWTQVELYFMIFYFYVELQIILPMLTGII